MKIIWTSEYEIGIGVIDQQHRRIVEYINDVHHVIENDGSVEDVRSILMNLVDYTLSHFAFEEALMEESGYSDLDLHQITHKTFIQQLEQLKVRFESGEAVAVELADMLQSWLLKHIVTDDESYTETVKEKLLHESPNQHASWVKRATARFFQ
jgi:hemerythrin